MKDICCITQYYEKDKYKIEQKGMTFNHDFGYSFTLFSSLLKGGKKKRRMNSKNRDQNVCLSAQSKYKGEIRNRREGLALSSNS